jgi:Zn-dependent protease with chaperone function
LAIIDGVDAFLTIIDVSTDVLAAIFWDIVESLALLLTPILYIVGAITYPIQTSLALVVGIILAAIFGFIGWIVGHFFHP